MKNSIKLICFIFLIITAILNSCKKEEIPTLTTASISNISGTSANCGGSIVNEGTGTIIARGICWSKEITPTLADYKTSEGAGAGTFTSSLTDLDGASTYYVRAYATNSAGTGYGMAMSFSTLGEKPIINVTFVTNIALSSAKLNGDVDANYLATTVVFEYGTTIAYGRSIESIPSQVTSYANVSANISDLSAGTIYHFRIKALNSLGTTYSEDKSFATLGQRPSAYTMPVTYVSKNSATLNGYINANYLQTSTLFEYGLSTNYGNSVPATPVSITGNSVTSVKAIVLGLIPGTIYHFRIRAENTIGTTFGEDLSFSTPNPIMSTMTDIDGNVYAAVTIGTQIWMAENLKTTKYRNGDAILTSLNGIDWAQTISGAYAIYVNNIVNNTAYGKLYNGYAVSDSRQICPTGWHIPLSTEWLTLMDNLGGESVAGGKLKNITGWAIPNTGATNESGFSALPGGYREGEEDTYQFYSLGQIGFWWGYNDTDASSKWACTIHNESATFSPFPTMYKRFGLSVRCLKD